MRDKYDRNNTDRPAGTRRLFDFSLIDVEEDQLQRWADEAAEARKAAVYDVDNVKVPTDFNVVPLQGTSAVKQSGKYVNGMRVVGKGQPKVEWHKKYWGQYTFQVSTISFPQTTASWLCWMWAHKIQYFFDDFYRAGSKPSHIYTDAFIDNYREPEHYTNLAANATLAIVTEKVRWIREQRPTNPT